MQKLVNPSFVYRGKDNGKNLVELHTAGVPLGITLELSDYELEAFDTGKLKYSDIIPREGQDRNTSKSTHRLPAEKDRYQQTIEEESQTVHTSTRTGPVKLPKGDNHPPNTPLEPGKVNIGGEEITIKGKGK